MNSAVKADKRTIDAIRKADRIPRPPTTAKPQQPVGLGDDSGGTTILWAKITAVTDANNYTVSIYDRSDEATPTETSKQCRVFDIVDQLAVNDWIPVQSSNITGEDYESIQQLGAVG